MEHIVFNDALTKPDLLVLRNLAADIKVHSLGAKGSQSYGSLTIDSHSHTLNSKFCNGTSEHAHC